MYYIKQITLVRNDETKSELNLKQGLNIIYGESNTGKSLIVDCIDYIFGSKKKPRFGDKLDIKKVEILLVVDDGEINMSREVGSNDVIVSSTFSEISSGTYKTGKTHNSLNSIWLKIMGIDENTKVLQTLNGKTQSLTLRTFYHTFLIDEGRAQSQNSVLSNGLGFDGRASTAVLSTLMFLATGENNLPNEVGKERIIRKERVDAVKKFVDRSLQRIGNTKMSDIEELSSRNPNELSDNINDLLNEIEAKEGVLKSALDEKNKIASEVIELDNQLHECKVLKNRNSILLTQYSSDIKRLTFIAEGDIHSSDYPKLEVCPFCNGKLSKDKATSCLDAAIAEVDKIEAQINDVQSLQKSIEAEMIEFNDKKQQYIKRINEIDTKIRAELRPQISNLKQYLEKYKSALNYHKAKEMIEQFSNVLTSELKTTENEESKEVKIDIKSKFSEVFEEKLTKELAFLLKECNYQNYKSSSFDLDNYDVIVNDQLKNTQGQGFRAYLNTIMALAVQNCLCDYGKYYPQLLVIDSPILSLKEKDDNQISETMKEGLFKYFINHQENKQTIIIENSVPKLDYSSVNIIEFTKDENRGRYGLIENYRD